ncbi:hypothetical protein HN51_043106 [Arachis hypogaea]
MECERLPQLTDKEGGPGHGLGVCFGSSQAGPSLRAAAPCGMGCATQPTQFPDHAAMREGCPQTIEQGRHDKDAHIGSQTQGYCNVVVEGRVAKVYEMGQDKVQAVD